MQLKHGSYQGKVSDFIFEHREQQFNALKDYEDYAPPWSFSNGKINTQRLRQDILL